MRLKTILLPMILSGLLIPGWAWAMPPAHAPRADAGHREAPRHAPKHIVIIPARNLSLDEAVRRVRKRGGRILDARTVERKGRVFHRIKVLTRDKRVRVIRFAAERED